MKTINRFSATTLLLLLSFSGFSQNQLCLSTYTQRPDSANKLKIFFAANNTSNDYSYKWNFGDNTSSDLRTPMHVYANPGKYKVCLVVVKKDSSCYNITCDSIMVGANTPPPCISSWVAHPDSANKKLWYFTAANTSSDFTYKWSFGDGTYSDLRTPTHAFSNNGTYIVCLKVTKKDSTCMNYTCDTIMVNSNTPQPCLSTWTAKPDSANKLKWFFNATNTSSDFAYKWYFGDATTSDLRTPSHTYAQPGKYKICLSVIKKDSTCANYTCDSIVIGATPPNNCTASWTAKPDSANKFKWYFVADNASSDFNYLWTINNVVKSDSRTPVITFNAPGTYTICLTVRKKDSSCVNTECKTITVGMNPSCNAEFSVSKKYDSTLRAMVYTFEVKDTMKDYTVLWTFGNDTGFITNGNKIMRLFPVPGVYTVCALLTKLNINCSHKWCTTITVTQDNQPCNAQWYHYPDSANKLKRYFYSALNSTAYTYKWTFGDGMMSDNPTPVHQYAKAGKYKVCLRVAKKDSTCTIERCDSIMVDVNSGCSANFYTSIPTSGGMVSFTNTSGGQYNKVQWKFGDGGKSDMINPVHTYAPGTYEVCLAVMRVENGDTLCYNSKCLKLVIGVNNSCVASFTKSVNQPTRTVFLSSTSSGSNLMHLWTFGDDSFAVAPQVSHKFKHNGTYRVCLYVVNANDTSCRSQHCESIVINYADTQVAQGSPQAKFVYTTDNAVSNSLKFINSSAGVVFSQRWDFGDGEFSEDANPVHSFPEKAWYLVCLQVTGSTSDTYCENVNMEHMTGIEQAEVIRHDALTLYPNPVADFCTLQFESPVNEPAQILVYDLSGQLLYNLNMDLSRGDNRIRIETSTLGSGCYFLTVQGQTFSGQIRMIK